VRLKPVIVLVVALFAAYKLLAGRSETHWGPGALAPADPVQREIDRAEAVPYKGIQLTPRARFSAEVRVLSRERYHLGDLATAVPLDLAVGWGPMSDSAVLAKIKVSQGNRFYFWRYESEPPIPHRDIETHSANWHLLPATSDVWDTLDTVQVGDIVKLEGELVDLKGQDFFINTSLTRDDTGAGACEVLYVESVTRRYR
jgi:hypothetical protein